MRSRRFPIVVSIVILVLAIGCALWPMAALVIDGLTGASKVEIGLSARQLGLFGKTALWAGLATILSIIAALPGIVVLSNASMRACRTWITACITLPVLCPPMVCVFGWQRWGGFQAVLNRLPFHQEVLCIAVWALWSSPIAAAIVGYSLGQRGRSAYEQGTLEAGRYSAFIHILLPHARSSIVISALVTWVLLMGEYSVPHACGLTVYATELLGIATSSASAASLLLPLAPSVAVVAGALVVFRARSRLQKDRGELENEASAGENLGTWSVAVCLMIVAVSAVLPISVLWVTCGSWAALRESIEVYGFELLQTAAVSMATGVLVVGGAWWGMGIVRNGNSGFRVQGSGVERQKAESEIRSPKSEILPSTVCLFLLRIAAVCFFLFGLAPAAMVGEGALRGYVAIPAIYDRWSLIVIGMSARFGWIGILVAQVAWRTFSAAQAEQARVDGADDWQIMTRVRFLTAWPTLAAGAGLVAALSAAEIAAASLVQVPSVGLISLILIEKFHRFEDQMLVALSIWLTLPAVPLAVALAMVHRRTIASLREPKRLGLGHDH